MKKEEILARCIDEVRSGKSTIADCLQRYPELSEELAPLLEIAAKVKTDGAAPSPEFRLRAKRYLFEEMQKNSSKVSHRFSLWPEHALARVLASVLIGIVVLGGAGGSVVYAAQSSLPGEFLYPVKTGVENVQLTLTTNPVAKANLHLDLAQQRVHEITRQIDLSRHIDTQTINSVKQQLDSAVNELSTSNNTTAVDATLSRMSADTLNQQLELQQVLSKAPEASQPVLQQAINDAQQGNTLAQLSYVNKDYLRSKPSIDDKELDTGSFQIDGVLLSVQDGRWNIGGTVLENVRYPGDTPAVGSHLIVQGIVRNNSVFISNIKINITPMVNTSPVPITVEGQYDGTYQNGDANVGGLPVKIDHNDYAQLQPGDRVQLRGERQGNSTSIPVSPNTPNSSNVPVTPPTTTTTTTSTTNATADSGTSNNFHNNYNDNTHTNNDNHNYDNDSYSRLKVTGKESKQALDQAGTTLSGILKAVDPSTNTIIVYSAGNNITIELGQSQSEGRGRGNENHDLSNQIGQNVTLSGLYKNNNIIFARDIQVNQN